MRTRILLVSAFLILSVSPLTIFAREVIYCPQVVYCPGGSYTKCATNSHWVISAIYNNDPQKGLYEFNLADAGGVGQETSCDYSLKNGNNILGIVLIPSAPLDNYQPYLASGEWHDYGSYYECGKNDGHARFNTQCPFKLMLYSQSK